MSDVITEYRIARALKSGPPAIRDGAKVVEMGADGTLTLLREGTNGWTCMPGVETASADMCADEMGMQWMMDVMAFKAKAHQYVARTDLHAQRRCATQLHRPLRSDQPVDPDRSALDAHLALHCRTPVCRP
jgi:hypothetical protein